MDRYPDSTWMLTAIPTGALLGGLTAYTWPHLWYLALAATILGLILGATATILRNS